MLFSLPVIVYWNENSCKQFRICKYMIHAVEFCHCNHHYLQYTFLTAIVQFILSKPRHELMQTVQ